MMASIKRALVGPWSAKASTSAEQAGCPRRQVESPDELDVGAERGRWNAQRFELGKYQVVDGVLSLGPGKDSGIDAGLRYGDAGGSNLVGIPDGDGRLARAGDLDPPLGQGGSRQVVGAVEARPTGDVLAAAVRIPGPDDQAQLVCRSTATVGNTSSGRTRIIGLGPARGDQSASRLSHGIPSTLRPPPCGTVMVGLRSGSYLVRVSTPGRCL